MSRATKIAVRVVVSGLVLWVGHDDPGPGERPGAEAAASINPHGPSATTVELAAPAAATVPCAQKAVVPVEVGRVAALPMGHQPQPRRRAHRVRGPPSVHS